MQTGGPVSNIDHTLTHYRSRSAVAWYLHTISQIDGLIAKSKATGGSLGGRFVPRQAVLLFSPPSQVNHDHGSSGLMST